MYHSAPPPSCFLPPSNHTNCHIHKFLLLVYFLTTSLRIYYIIVSSSMFICLFHILHMTFTHSNKNNSLSHSLLSPFIVCWRGLLCETFFRVLSTKELNIFSTYFMLLLLYFYFFLFDV